MLSRPYGYWTDGQLQAEQARLEALVAEKDADQAQHGRTKPQKGSELAHAHAGLLISREALALSQEQTEVFYEVEFRSRGQRKQLD